MKRRSLIRACVVGAAGLARADVAISQARPSRVAVLMGSRAEDTRAWLEAFLAGLAEAGFVAGRNLVLDVRYANGMLDQLPALAQELVAAGPDLIFAPPAPATAAAKRATSAIPIVFTFVNDPVALGFVQSLGRPGGNLTGLSNNAIETAGKRVELLHELVPRARRLAIWFNPDTVNDSRELAEAEAAAKRRGMQVVPAEARAPDGYDTAAAAIAKAGADIVYVVANPGVFSNRQRVVALLNGIRRPAIYSIVEFVSAGGLASYAADFVAMSRQAASYAARILRGARPADLPVEQPNRYALALNRRTARELGLQIPQHILLQADEVIE